jgi:RNA polymerase sigma factor (sigma-70 family)
MTAVADPIVADLDLLAQYRGGSQAAFTELVARHIDMVYSAALRQVRRHDVADDVTQAVFLLLSQKAASLNQHTILSAWLYRAAGYCAANALRQERIRERHERRQAEMAGEDMRGQTPKLDGEAEWAELSTVLDQAIAKLPAVDRSAIVLRYLQGQSHEQVGSDLGLSADSARKRVDRAVVKLRKLIGRLAPGVTLPAVTGLMSAHAMQQAPAHLLSSVSKICATASAGATAGTPAALIAKGAWNMIIWTNIKATASVVAVVTVLTAGAMTAMLMKDGGGALAQAATAPAPTTVPAANEPKTPRAALELIAKAIREGQVDLLKAHIQADTPGEALVVDNQARTCASVANFKKAYAAAYGKAAASKLPAMVGPLSVPAGVKFTLTTPDTATADYGQGQTIQLIRQNGVWKLAYDSLAVSSLPIPAEQLASYLDRTLAAMDEVTDGINNHEFPKAEDALAALTQRTRDAAKGIGTSNKSAPTTAPQGL